MRRVVGTDGRTVEQPLLHRHTLRLVGGSSLPSPTTDSRSFRPTMTFLSSCHRLSLFHSLCKWHTKLWY